MIDAADLGFFSETEDLRFTDNHREFNFKPIDQAITDSAHRALQICNAQSQLLLARYQANSQELQANACTIAFNLGQFDFDPEQPRNNPFEEPSLQDAWQQGYQDASQQRRDRSFSRLQDKLWEQGINPEDLNSQYELCALQLYQLATTLEQPQQAARAKRLASEMCRYHEGAQPSPQRQQEIDRFLAQQAKRIAADLEL